MLRNPFLLVSASTSSGDSSNRCTDASGSLAFLGLRDEREVGVVTNSPEETENDEVGDPARESDFRLRIRRKADGKMQEDAAQRRA